MSNKSNQWSLSLVFEIWRGTDRKTDRRDGQNRRLYTRIQCATSLINWHLRNCVSYITGTTRWSKKCHVISRKIQSIMNCFKQFLVYEIFKKIYTKRLQSVHFTGNVKTVRWKIKKVIFSSKLSSAFAAATATSFQNMKLGFFFANKKLFTVALLKTHRMIWYTYHLQTNNTSVPAASVICSDMDWMPTGHDGWSDRSV